MNKPTASRALALYKAPHHPQSTMANKPLTAKMQSWFKNLILTKGGNKLRNAWKLVPHGTTASIAISMLKGAWTMRKERLYREHMSQPVTNAAGGFPYPLGLMKAIVRPGEVIVENLDFLDTLPKASQAAFIHTFVPVEDRDDLNLAQRKAIKNKLVKSGYDDESTRNTIRKRVSLLDIKGRPDVVAAAAKFQGQRRTKGWALLHLEMHLPGMRG